MTSFPGTTLPKTAFTGLADLEYYFRRNAVPDGNACRNLNLYYNPTKCSDCEKFYDGTMNNDDDGKCVWMPHVKKCWTKKKAIEITEKYKKNKKKLPMEYTEFCTDQQCSDCKGCSFRGLCMDYDPKMAKPDPNGNPGMTRKEFFEECINGLGGLDCSETNQELVCQCDDRGKQVGPRGLGDWCYLRTTPCKLLTNTTTDWTWARCVLNGVKQIECDVAPKPKSKTKPAPNTDQLCSDCPGCLTPEGKCWEYNPKMAKVDSKGNSMTRKQFSEGCIKNGGIDCSETNLGHDDCQDDEIGLKTLAKNLAEQHDHIPADIIHQLNCKIVATNCGKGCDEGGTAQDRKDCAALRKHCKMSCSLCSHNI